jgi:hypothetical protein
LVTERLKQLRLARSRPAARSSLDVGTRRLELSFLSSLGPDELLFRLTELTEGADEKLGVENRAAAAARAVGCLS